MTDRLDVEKEIKTARAALTPESAKQMEQCLQELTTSGHPSPDAGLMAKIKRFCRMSDKNVRYTFLLIMKHLNKKHSEVRLSAFQVAHELFSRSHVFREELVTHLHDFLALTTGIDADKPLPPPKSAADKMKTEALQAVMSWSDKFGLAYKKLAVGFDYLKNCKHVDFNNIRAQNEAERERRDAEERRKKKMMADKLTKVLKDISDQRQEITSCVQEAEGCLRLLLPTPTDFFLPVSEECSNKLLGTAQNDAKNRLSTTSGGLHNLNHNKMEMHPPRAFSSVIDNCASHQSLSVASSSIDMEENVHVDSSLTATQNKNKGEQPCYGNLESLEAITNNSTKRSEKSDPSLQASEKNVRHQTETILSEKNDGFDDCQKEVADSEDYGDQEEDNLQEHGVPHSTFNLVLELPPPGQVSLRVSEDNRDIVRSLTDSSRMVTNKYLPKVTRWLEILGKTGAKEADIKSAIDLKIQLEDIKLKCSELQLLPENSGKSLEDADSDDEDFEEVPEKEGYEPHIPWNLRAEYGLDPPSLHQPKVGNERSKHDTDWEVKNEASTSSRTAASSKHWSLRDRIHSQDTSDPTSMAAALARIKPDSSVTVAKNSAMTTMYQQLNSDPGKTTLNSEPDKTTLNSDPGDTTLNCDPGDTTLNSDPRKTYHVPVVAFGEDLAHWENPDQMEAPAVVKLDSLHRFWAPADVETEKPSQHDIAALKNRVFCFAGKFEPVKWKCRALLPSGKLCERMDRIKCPFHGQIIPRDKTGHPNGQDQPSTSGCSSVKSDTVKEEDVEPPPWLDPELQQDIEQATGLDLGSARSQKLLDKKTSGKTKGKKRKIGKKKSGLTDIEAANKTARKRLEQKVFNKRAVKRVCSSLDLADYKRVRDKFANQFNYI